ncbi:hypothetical protein FA822_22135 [Escherichia coli]|nr:hypothetical protein [Escherichia coli]EFD4962009.1 hypothetical protein [Escherichia coli]
MLRVVTSPHSLKPVAERVFMPEKWYWTLNALVVANTGLSACWLFRKESFGQTVIEVKNNY